MSDTTFDSLCRLCLKRGFLHANIFHSRVPNGNVIYEVLNFVYNLEVTIDDGLTANICRPCIWKLREFEIYKINVHEAKSELLNLKKNAVKKESEEIVVADEDNENHDEIEVVSGSVKADDVQDGGRYSVETNIEADIKVSNEVTSEDKSTEEVANDSSRKELDESDEFTLRLSPDEFEDEMEKNTNEASYPETGSQNTRMLRSRRVSSEADSQTRQHCRREEGISECSEDERRKRNLKASDKVIGSQDSEASQVATKRVRREEDTVDNSDFIRSNENVDNNGYECKSLLKDHRPVQGKKRPYVCDLCKKVFNRSDLIRHLKTHNVENVHECGVCKKQFLYYSVLKTHQVIHSVNKPYVCKYCERGFSFKCSLGRHLKIHTGMKTHECRFCSVKFHTRFELNKHCRKHDSGILRQKVSEARKPTEEENPREEKGRYECKTCRKVFLYKSILSCHETTHDTEGRFVCDHCRKVFYHKMILTRHILGHVEKRFEHKCKYCGKQYRHKCLLARHEFIHKSERSHVCEFCKKGFKSQIDLNGHIWNHTGRKMHDCKICNKRFRHEFYLLEHLRCHETYKCDLCEKEYRIKSLLREHIHRHIGEKMYECKICRRKFITNSNLTRHLLTHEKNRRFQGTICDKMFKQRCALRNHKKTHAKKPIKCPFCTKCFMSASSLCRHKKIHYKEEVNAVQ